VAEILRTGDLERVAKLRSNEKLLAVNLFLKWGTPLASSLFCLFCRYRSCPLALVL
jgi:hypothetical protein